MNHSNLCMNCFSEIADKRQDICPVCGWDHTKEQVSEALEFQTKIGGRYLIGRAKTINGEGITYAAYDINFRHTVELREFYPLSIAERNQEDNWIIPMAGYDSLYNTYLAEFIELSKNISRLKKVTVIQAVLDIVEENQTAYVCYEYVPSMSLQRYVEKSGVLSWNTVSSLFLPVLSALSLLNSLGAPHLGVSPETVMVTTEGNLLVTGFCVQDARKKGTSLIDELFKGCAALEQYIPKAICGETSDVYAAAATMVFAASGILPPSAKHREKDSKLLLPWDRLKDLPPHVVTALANALQVNKEHRTASFETFKTEMSSSPKIVTQVGSTDAIRKLPPAEHEERRGLSPVGWLIITGVITAIALIIVAAVWLNNQGLDNALDKNNIVSAQSGLGEPVPSLIGDDFEEWQEKIAETDSEYDFTLKMSSLEFSDTVAEGIIISQIPLPDEPVPGDKVISVTVSRGSTTRVLPEITGQLFSELSVILEGNGFIVSREDQPDANIAENVVIGYKDHTAGESLEYGSTITLIVSAGAEEE